MLSEAFPQILFGSVSEAWARCLPVWRQQGRVEDLPRGTRVTMYRPTLARRLGTAFAESYANEYDFVIGRIRGGDAVESLCAFEIMVDMGPIVISGNRGTSAVLFALADPIPEILKQEIQFDYAYRNFSGSTLGDLIRFDNECP
jgi:hypothetical protein